MKQTQMYVCTLKQFISSIEEPVVQVDDDLGMRWTHGIYIGLYTVV